MLITKSFRNSSGIADLTEDINRFLKQNESTIVYKDLQYSVLEANYKITHFAILIYEEIKKESL